MPSVCVYVVCGCVWYVYVCSVFVHACMHECMNVCESTCGGQSSSPGIAFQMLSTLVLRQGLSGLELTLGLG